MAVFIVCRCWLKHPSAPSYNAIFTFVPRSEPAAKPDRITGGTLSFPNADRRPVGIACVRVPVWIPRDIYSAQSDVEGRLSLQSDPLCNAGELAFPFSKRGLVSVQTLCWISSLPFWLTRWCYRVRITCTWTLERPRDNSECRIPSEGCFLVLLAPRPRIS